MNSAALANRDHVSAPRESRSGAAPSQHPETTHYDPKDRLDFTNSELRIQ